MAPPENQFFRDLKLLMGIGAATALLIAGGGYLALRGLRWDGTEGILGEVGVYAALGAALLVAVALWAWRVIRRLKRRPPPVDQP